MHENPNLALQNIRRTESDEQSPSDEERMKQLTDSGDNG